MIVRRAHDGYVLLLVLLALMGIGGVVLAGFTQQAKQEQEARRYAHNQSVLRKAKQALLMFAYNYPQTNNRGPGRLPCPDHDNDGAVDFPLDCDTVGRFPWRDTRLNIADPLSLGDPLQDASGETLWYAVSDAFDNEAGGTVNADTLGTITLVDSAGGVLYDGSVAGIAAVIIAPGSIVKRDEDNNGSYEFTQLRTTALQQTDPRNYLDTFNGFDNSVFTNGESDTSDDGFILGPIYDIAEDTIVVNDQIVIVTADEVIAMAQKSVLQTYKDAINGYRANIGADVYPWLDDYTTTDLTLYDGDVGVRLGRVPSMFAEYFSVPPAGDGQQIITDLEIDINLNGVDFDYNMTIPASATPDVFFDTNGDLSTSFDAPRTITRYFWDGHDTNSPSSPADGIWELCPPVTDDEEDCNQDGYNNFIGGANSVDWMKVRRVTITLTNGAAAVPFRFPLGDFSGSPLIFTAPDGTSHARVTGSYDDGTYISVTWTQDDDFQSSFVETPAGNNGTIGVNNVDVTLIYYPVLPNWALASEDDWHDSVQFAYSEGYRPGGPSSCTTGTDCLEIDNFGGVQNDKVAVLTLASDHAFIDEAADGFQNDLTDIFDAENAHENDLAIPGSGDDDPADGILDQDIFAVRTGNDDLLVIR